MPDQTPFYQGKDKVKERVKLLFQNPDTRLSQKTGKNYRMYKLSTPEGERNLFTEEDSWAELDKINKEESFDLIPHISKPDGKMHTSYTVEKLTNHESAAPVNATVTLPSAVNAAPGPADVRQANSKVWDQKDLRKTRAAMVEHAVKVVLEKATEIPLNLIQVTGEVINVADKFTGFVWQDMKRPTDSPDDDLPF